MRRPTSRPRHTNQNTEDMGARREVPSLFTALIKTTGIPKIQNSRLNGSIPVRVCEFVTERAAGSNARSMRWAGPTHDPDLAQTRVRPRAHDARRIGLQPPAQLPVRTP